MYAAVLHTTGHVTSTTLTIIKIPDTGNHGVQKPVRGDFVHLYCMYFSASKVDFINWFLHYAWYTQYPAFSWQHWWKPQCSSGQSMTQHILKLGTSQIHDKSIFYFCHPAQQWHKRVLLPALFQIMSFRMLRKTWQQYAKHQLRHLYHLTAYVTIFLHPTTVIP